jgi:hypothetical protein
MSTVQLLCDVIATDLCCHVYHDYLPGMASKKAGQPTNR